MLLDGFRILDPIADYTAEISGWADKIVKSGFGLLLDNEQYLNARPNWDTTLMLTNNRSTTEKPALATLMNYLEPQPF